MAPRIREKMKRKDTTYIKLTQNQLHHIYIKKAELNNENLSQNYKNQLA